MLKGALAVILALFVFATGVNSGSADPTKWLVWGGMGTLNTRYG